MIPQKIKKYLFRHKHVNLLIVAAVALSALIFSLFIVWCFHRLPLELYLSKEISTEDIDFTDIYYQTKEENHKKNILLVNSGSLNSDSIRPGITRIIHTIDSLRPNTIIGVDHYFVDDKGDDIDRPLNSILINKKVVFGRHYENQSRFPLDDTGKVNIGIINFPVKEQTTVREYYKNHIIHNIRNNSLDGIASQIDTTIESFAVKLLRLYDQKFVVTQKEIDDSIFMIRYTSSAKGYYNIFNPVVINADAGTDFPAVEGKDLLKADPAHLQKIQQLLNDSTVVIVGLLGKTEMDNLNDIEDKHKVPNDFHLFNRLKEMPGAVIHANALDSLINEKPIQEINKLVFYFFLYFVIMIFWTMLRLLDKLRLILIKQLIEIIVFISLTMILIWLSQKLMQAGYHLPMGEVLAFVALAVIELKLFGMELYECIEKYLHHRVLVSPIKSIVIKKIKIANAKK